MNLSRKGFTLTEMMLTIAIIGVGIMLTRLGMNFLSTLGQQNLKMETQRDAEAIIFNITRDIRNAKEIVDVQPDHLVLNSFNMKAFSFASPQLFSNVNIGTITYQFHNDGGGLYLARSTQFPTDGGAPNVKQLLRGVILAPDTTNYMFKGGPGLAPPYDSVEVVLRLKSGFSKDKVLTYDESAVKRTARH